MPASANSSPSGQLPFLILPSTNDIIPLHKLHHLIVSKFEIPANPRATIFLNLVDTKIHSAWVYAHYFTDEFEKSVIPLLTVPEGFAALQYIVRYSHRAARKKELEKRFISGIRQDVIYQDADEAFGALSALLGDNTYFFGERYNQSLPSKHVGEFSDAVREPGLLDVAVFAYIFTALATLDEKSKLLKMISKFENLNRHADSIYQMVYMA